MKFYSEKLNKLFDSEKELINEEKAAEKAAMEKTKKAEAKKAEAKVVEDAFKARNAVRLAYNKNISEAKDVYTKGLKSLRSSFDAVVVAENKKLDEAEKAYDDALKEFIAKHPEGYHLTLTDSDNVVTISNNTIHNGFDFFDKLFDMMKI